MMIATTIIMMAAHTIGAYLTISARRRVKAETYSLPLTVYTYGHLIVSITVFAAAIMAYQHRGILELAFGNGIKAVIADYAHGGDVKEEVDIFQMEHRCCGADTYTDWFTTHWFDNKKVHVDEISTNDTAM